MAAGYPCGGLELDTSPLLGSFVDARLSIINDPTAPAGDRLRAMEQLESRALGKPKESVTVDTEESETERALKALTPEERLALWQKRGLHAVAEH